MTDMTSINNEKDKANEEDVELVPHKGEFINQIRDILNPQEPAEEEEEEGWGINWGSPEDTAKDIYDLEHPEADEGGAGSGRKPEGVTGKPELQPEQMAMSDINPNYNAFTPNPRSERLQNDPELSRMTEEAPDDIDSELFGTAEEEEVDYDMSEGDRARLELRNQDTEAKPKTDSLSNIIDDLNEKNAPPGGWDDEDKVAEEDGQWVDFDEGHVVRPPTITDIPDILKSMGSGYGQKIKNAFSNEDVSVAGPPVGDTIPANGIIEQDDEIANNDEPVGEATATEDGWTDPAGFYHTPDEVSRGAVADWAKQDSRALQDLTYLQGEDEFDDERIKRIKSGSGFDEDQWKSQDFGWQAGGESIKSILSTEASIYDYIRDASYDQGGEEGDARCTLCGKFFPSMVADPNNAFRDPVNHLEQVHGMKWNPDYPEDIATEEFKEEDHPRDGGKFTTKGGGDSGGKSKSNLSDMSEKDLIKSIKGGSKEWSEWGRNEKTEDAYAEIERRNKEIPTPKRPEGARGTIFRDDPDAVSKMEAKVKYLEDVSDYWKKVTKFPNRDYHHHDQLGDAKWYALSNNSANLRDAKKKLEGIKAQQGRGTQLVRKTTYKSDQYGKSKPRFYYSEEPKEEEKPKEEPKRKLLTSRTGSWHIDDPMKPEHRQNLINDVRERINRLQSDKDKETAGKKIDKVEDMSDEQLSKFFMWMGGKPVYSEARESEWRVHTITHGEIPVTLGEKADQFDAIQAVKRMYFGIEDGFIDDSDILSAVKIGEAVGYEGMSWNLLPRDVKAKLGESFIPVTESCWSTYSNDERKEMLEEVSDEEVPLLTQLLDNELEEEEKGHDEEEDIAIVLNLLDAEEAEFKKKAIEVGSNPNPSMDDSYRQFVEPTEAPTGKVIVDQTYGVSEPETPDGQDLTGITVGEGENKLDFTKKSKDEVEKISYGDEVKCNTCGDEFEDLKAVNRHRSEMAQKHNYMYIAQEYDPSGEPDALDTDDDKVLDFFKQTGDEEIIEKTPPKIKYLYYKQYPFGRRSGKQNPFGEATEVDINTMNHARVWWDNKYPERQWSDMRIGERQNAILAFLRDPSTSLEYAEKDRPDKAHISWKNHGIDDYIDKAEKEYLEGNEWLNDPQEDIDLPRLRELEEKDRAGTATLDERNEAVTLMRKYYDWTDADKSNPFFTEGGLGSGKSGHQGWMRAIEEEHDYNFCDKCSMITEQINKKCQMCGKRLN